MPYIDLTVLEATGAYYIRETLTATSENYEVYTGSLYFYQDEIKVRAYVNKSTGTTFIYIPEGTPEQEQINRNRTLGVLAETVYNILNTLK